MGANNNMCEAVASVLEAALGANNMREGGRAHFGNESRQTTWPFCSSLSAYRSGGQTEWSSVTSASVAYGAGSEATETTRYCLLFTLTLDPACNNSSGGGFARAG